MNNHKSLMAERAVIGSVLINNDCLDEVFGELSVNDFENIFTKRIFTTIHFMRKKNPDQIIDILTVASSVKLNVGESENEIFIGLGDIASSTYSPSNIKAYIEMVKKESNRRRTAELINIANQKVSKGDDDYLEFIRNGLSSIELNVPFIIRSFGSITEEMVAKLEDDCNKGGGLTGISTGFYDLDDYTNGFQNGDLIILAARPSMGKTMFMLNIAENISLLKQKEPCVFFSLEMPSSQIVKRSLSRISGVNGGLIFKAKLETFHWEKIIPSLKKMESSKLFINDSSRMTVYQMRSYCRKIRNEHGLKAIFVDYIGLVDGEGENETIKLGNISRDLKAMAKDFNVPVIALSQLNRNIELRKDKTPVLSDLRQSGNIEQDADIVMFLDRDKDYGRDATIIISKHRNGRIGEFKLLLDIDHFEFKNFHVG